MNYSVFKQSKNIVFGVVKLLCISVMDVAETAAQSLLVGIPSAEVAHKGKLEFTHESQVNFWESDKIKWNSFNFACYGIGHETEITANLLNLNNNRSSNISVAVGFKTSLPVLKKTLPETWEMKWTGGQNVMYSIQKQKFGSWTYSHLSVKLPRLRTQLIGGLSFGTSQMFGYRYVTDAVSGGETEIARRPLAFIGGFVQPVYKNFSIVGDWYSGTHDLAAFIPALQFDKVFRQHTFIAGYKIPNNAESGSQAVICEIMFRF
jgi:hypothetical protein